MHIRTYRAGSMHEALVMIRSELGPDAAVLHTREVERRGLRRLMPGPRQIEVTASLDVPVPSRLRKEQAAAEKPQPALTAASHETVPASAPAAPQRTERDFENQLGRLQQMVEQLCQRNGGHENDLPEPLFRLYTDLIDDDVDESLARELLERVRVEMPDAQFSEPLLVREQLARLIENEIRVQGPIRPRPGKQHLVALVGPTGVGKTTTIAKLAANFRLIEKRNVGLITVDTYRIAAVEQLRTYADIIDLPMQVVSTPREMREAVRRMSDLDLILLDTAGRSPRDDIQIQELKTFLEEADADEVHLVLSSVAGASSLRKTAERFASVGVTSLLLTKLDEASALGNLLPLLRSVNLPLSYLTTGQNVPDDIEPARAERLARLVLGLDKAPM